MNAPVVSLHCLVVGEFCYLKNNVTLFISSYLEGMVGLCISLNETGKKEQAAFL